MAIKVSDQLSLSDISVSRRKCKHTFFSVHYSKTLSFNRSAL
ncbi:hypothetical protein ACRRVB_01030 [Candidatus Cardinium hertigii]